MSQAIQLQVTQVGLEQSIAAAMKRVGSSSQINLGTNSRQINALSQPLGRITGQADEFSKSMEAANARVLAFGASAGIIAGVSKAMSGLVSSTIKVEKNLVEIGSVLNKTGADLDKFGQDIFNVAKNTGQSFDEVAKGALELSRQGLNAEDTLARLNDALILSRLSGLDATQSVEGLTAAFNSFQKSGITTAEILNKVVAVSQEYAVSERDIIEGLKRSAAVADLAGVSFEELAALITAVQQKTARGGAVIGNAFKTIFSRLQDKAVLSDLDDMGIAITDLQGNVLPALKILEGLAGKMDKISQIEQADIAKKLGGVYQLDKLLAALKDLSSEASVTQGALEVMGAAGDSAYKKNAILNETLSALINKVAVSAEQLGAKLGEIGVTDSLKNILGFFNNLLEGIQNILGEESGLGNLVRGLVKGLGSFLAGPGLALFGGIILKLSKDLVQFGFASLKAFFGIGKAAKDVQNVEGAISQILAKNVGLQQQLFALEGNRAAQLRLITGALVEQEALLRRSASISSGLAAPLYNVGARATSSGLRVGNSAGGYMPTVAKESKAIKQGVGGARSGDKPVVMPNFNFGGGKKGTMVAHTGEYVVPNFNGSGGSAVFNRRMVQSMGLPSGAKKIGAAGGFVPNFVDEANRQREVKGLGTSTILKSIGFRGNESYDEIFKNIKAKYLGSEVEWVSDKKNAFNIFQNGDKDKPLTSQAISVTAIEKQRASKEIKKLESVYDANAGFNKAVMLIPQNQAFNAASANTDFKKENQERYGYKGFLGGVAGVDKNISNIDKRNLSEISNIDNLIGGALSVAAISVLEKIQPGLKVDDVSSFSVENIKKTLEAGGAGAFGSIKGALFESIIGKVAKAKGRKFEGQGSLDIDFDAGGKDSRRTLETIFGLTADQFDFADFKNSIGQKDSYINQVISYLPKNKDLSKQANAAGGYIPNFSKYIYDSDRLNPDKGATLAAVLSSKAKKNLLIGPAGSGKSTFAGKSGQFLSGIDDVPKATEIDILSGAARAKGGLSKSLESIIAAVNSSGGKVSYLYTKNLEILSRRRSRTSPSEGDLRSIKQLKGTRYAPLNQFDFLSNVKSKSKNFNLIQGAAGGYIPNFVGKSREVGRGVQGAFYKLGNQKDGTQVGVKKFFKDGPSRAVEFEWLVAEYLSKHTKIPAVFGPKNLSTLQDSVRKQSIRKELVSDPLAKNALGSQVSEMFGRGVLFNALQAQGLSIGDLHGSNYTVNANAEKAINELGNFPQNATGAFSTLRDMASKGSRIGILDTGAAKVSEPARTAIGNILKMASQSKASAAGGFIPNFNASASEKERRGRGVNRFSSIPVDLSKTKEESIPDKIFRGVRFNRKKRKDFLNKGLVGTKLTSKEIFNKKTLLGKAFNPMRSDGGGLQPATTDIRVAAAFAAGRKEIQSTDQVQAFADKLEISPLSSPSLIQKLGDLIYQRGNTESEERKSAIENSIKSISGFNKESLLGGIYEKAVDPNNFIKSSTISKYSKPDVADSLIKQIRTGSNLGKEPQLADLRGGKIPAEKEIRVLGGFGKVDRGYLVTAKSEEQLRQQAERKELDKLEMIKRLGNVYKDEYSQHNSIGANYQTESFKSQAGGFLHTLILRQKDMYLMDVYSKSLKDKEDLIKHIVEVAKARNLPLMPAHDLDKGDKSMLKLLNKSGIKPAPVSKKKSAAGGFIPNFADIGGEPRPRVTLTRTPEQLAAHRKASKKAENYRKASGAIGKVFGAIDKASPTVLVDGVISGAEIQGLNLDYIKTLIENNGAIAQMFLGDKGSNFVVQAKKYGVTVQQSAMKKLTSLAAKALNKVQGLAGGFLPNFANPLKDAVGREMAAGVPASQIYIDKSPALKNAGNPMGLMVANRRDEPSGGFQGISRARREGANPMMYGAAGGFVPNYAAIPAAPTIGSINNAKFQQALNAFAIELQNGSKTIKQVVDELGKLNPAAKKLTPAAQALAKKYSEELNARQQAIATLVLESNANKKIAKQLDKVYLEYNKSEKTNQDLQRAQAKAAAILNKTSLGTRTQAAVVGNTASLAANRTTAQPGTAGGNRDMLGTIFAVQSGLSVLTGATEGATSSIAKYTNVVADSVGSATSTLFAFQGLATAMPKFAGFLGPAGIAFSGLTALYKIGTGVLNEYFGINKIVAQSLYTISKAADEASVNLSKLDPEAKSKIEKESKDILAAGLKTGRFETVTEGSIKESDKTTYQREIIARFEKDVTGKLAKNAQDSIAQARGAGVSSAKINEVIQKYSKDALITLDEASELPKVLSSLITEVDTLAKSAIDLMRKSEDPNVMAAKAAIGKMTPAEISKQADPSKMTMAERAVFAGYQPDTKIEDMAEREKKLIEDYATGEDGTTFKFKNPENPTTDPFGFLRKRLQLDAGPTSDKRLEDLGLSIQQESKTKSDEGVEKDKSFKVNLGAIQAEIALENKLASFKENAASIEIAKQKKIEKIKNDNFLTEDQRAKKIAQATYDYDEDIQSLQTIEQKTKNIGQALIESVKSGIGIIPDQIQATIEKIQQGLSKETLPEFNIENLNEYIAGVKEILTASGVYEDNQKAIVEAILGAEAVNKNLTAEQMVQFRIAAEKLGIELETLDITKKRAIEEAKINSMMDSAKAVASFNLEKRSLDIAFDTLAINQQIEKIKRETSLNELEKAQQIFKLEEQRVGLEEGKITVDYDKSANDAAEEFKNRVLSTAKGFGIEPKIISGSLSGGAEEVIKAARAKILDSSEKTNFNNLIENDRKRYESDVELAKRRRDIDKSGVAPALESDVQKRAREGFSGGMEEGVNKLQDSINTFAFDLGEKIPQMFSDNMSSAINKMIEGGESFGNILQGAAYEFVKGINQANIKNLSDKFSNSLFNKNESGQTGIGSFFGSIGNLFASGGKVTGGSGSKDDVPAMLMGGEYVVNKKAVSKYGPKFLEAINNGTLNGYANGGMVDSEKNPYDKLIQNIYEERRSKAKKIQGGNAGFYTPGTYNTGAILGKRDLLSFATQSGTSGVFDRMTNENGYQSIALEPESPMLSVSGMRNSPMFDATQSAKEQAFDLYLQQYNAEREAKKQAKEQKKALTTQLIMLAGSAALGPVIKAAGSGFGAAFKGADGQGFMSQLGAGFKGALYGSNIGGQQVGGLSNLFSSAGKAFSGDFTGASNQFKMSQIGNGNQLSDLYKSDEGFASYIDGMGGFNASGAPKVTSIISEARRSGYGKGININGNNLPESVPSSSGDSLPQEYSSSLVELETIRRKTAYGILTNQWKFEPDQARDWMREHTTRELDLLNLNDTRIDPVPARAIGGMIPSRSGIDTVPAMLSGGEFVMNRSAVQGIGASNLQSMNSGGTSITSEETSKELNEKLLAKLDELINSSGSAGNITINVAPSGQTTQENSQDPSAGRQQLARQIKDAVLQIINDEKRIGGSLRR